MYIHEDKCWPSFTWDKDAVHAKLNHVNKKVGYLMGRLSVIGFDAHRLSPIYGLYVSIHSMMATAALGVPLQTWHCRRLKIPACASSVFPIKSAKTKNNIMTFWRKLKKEAVTSRTGFFGTWTAFSVR